MAVTVKISETYDLKTTTNKLGIIGIHTPSSRQLRTMYPGLVKNHKFVRLLKCDVVGACASVLPADPLKVGVSEGQIAPEDMFNPILYKPVSNESFETLVNKIYTMTDVTTLGSLAKEEKSANAFDIYYSMLAQNKHWKKAMPQRGFALYGLYPICYQMINTYGQNLPVNRTHDVLDATGVSTVDIPDTDGVNVTTSADWSTATEIPLAVSFRGKSVKMPRIPMHYGPESVDSVESFVIPKTWVAMFLIPPCKLVEIFYRMRVTWTVRFENVCTAQDIGSVATMTALTGASYGTEISYAKSSMDLDNSLSMVDTNDVEINKIMDS